jgi:hypothetical protein
MLLHRTALREDAWQVYGLGAIGVAAGAIWAVLTEVDLPKG